MISRAILPWLVSKNLTLEALRVVKHRKWRPGLLTGRFHEGLCPICNGPSVFVEENTWLRDGYRCIRCRSIPRWRALIRVLETEFPRWRALSVHESSPSGAASKKLKAECSRYVASHFYSDVPPGQMKGEYRSENLESQTFPDASFDLVVTQDVFEHVLRPESAFREVARTLKPGGSHVFTVPWYYWKETLVRAVEDGPGKIRHLTEPDYHGNPIDSTGSLVVTEWGSDLLDVIERCSGLSTTVHHLFDRHQGIDGEFREVFVSKKAG